MHLPILDLTLPDKENVLTLHEACINHGFFVIVNHGIDKAFTDKALEQAKKFFDLPLEVKTKISAIYFRGYTPLSVEKPDPANQSVGDTKESFYIGPEPQEGEEISQFVRDNMWPKIEDMPEFRAFMMEYIKKLTELGKRVANLLGKAVALCADDPKKQIPYDFSPGLNNPASFLRLLHYTPDKSEPEKGVFGCGAHTDYGMLTLLLIDDVEGLQIFPRPSRKVDDAIPVDDGNWINVPTIPGSFVVNLGDMVQRWTNNRYKSTVHRVVNLSNRHRFSIPFFFEPDLNYEMKCIETCLNEGEKPLYEPITPQKYLENRYARKLRRNPDYKNF